MSTSRPWCIIDQKRASATPTEVTLPPILKAGVPLLVCKAGATPCRLCALWYRAGAELRWRQGARMAQGDMWLFGSGD